ncbi:hypothetical protein GMA12_12525 [Kocuria sediminis]|uniref:STAS domain-containing protein n=1 Tax=Kocuria sediminis TaxID=1038857 RepID=A0A6N8GRP2_9MICC|nr:hypothetical protein [Kocuria sediminis]MUN63953.1 hypothetical protein [Kocuria sediminis]
MHHKLSVLVQVDLDGKHVRLVVTGCVTEVNHRALCPLVRRARTLVPGIAVIVDATAAHHVEPAAVDLLRWAAEHDDAVRGTPPVEFVLPHELPAHDTVTRLAAWTSARRGPGAPEPVGTRHPARRRTAPRARLAG